MMVSSARAMAATLGADEPPRRKKKRANSLMKLREQKVRRALGSGQAHNDWQIALTTRIVTIGRVQFKQTQSLTSTLQSKQAIQEKPTARREAQPLLIKFDQRGSDVVLGGSSRHPVVPAS